MTLEPVDEILDEDGGVQNVPVMCVPQLRGVGQRGEFWQNDNSVLYQWSRHTFSNITKLTRFTT
jgi:hypothetical protein